MTNFDEFFKAFTNLVFNGFEYIKKDPKLIDAMLECDETKFSVRCWLAQKRIYFGW